MPTRTVVEPAARLADARRATLALFDALQRALPPSMEVRFAAEIDPPLWLLGRPPVADGGRAARGAAPALPES